MPIKVKGFLTFQPLLGGSGEIVLDLDRPTVGEVLAELARRFGPGFDERFFDPKRTEPQARNLILINGRHLRLFPAGLETKLQDNDLLALFPPVAGG
ncbi:MAG: MoaD family protein [Thermodesulfobacteriota bacterium]